MSRVKWVMPLGITGVTPLAAVGPVSVGPSHSGAERSSLEAPHVTVFVDALQSLLQRKAVLRLLLMRPQARSSGASCQLAAHAHRCRKCSKQHIVMQDNGCSSDVRCTGSLLLHKHVEVTPAQRHEALVTTSLGSVVRDCKLCLGACG